MHNHSVIKYQQSIDPDWLTELTARDKVRVFYKAQNRWFCKELAVSYVSVSADGQVTIPAAASSKLSQPDWLRSRSYEKDLGIFSTQTGLRIAKTEADLEYGELDFIAPLPDDIPRGVRELLKGQTAFTVIDDDDYVDDDDDEGEYAEEASRFEDLKEWLAEVEKGRKVGVFWTEKGASSEVVPLWCENESDDTDHIDIITPSECGSGELIHQLLKVLTATYKDLHKSSFVTEFLNLPYEKVWDIRNKNAEMPFPKDLPERRHLLERVYKRYQGLKDKKVLVMDADNLKPAALKEIIYLNKRLRCPFILTGNEELVGLVKSAKTDWISVFERSGEEFDPEFLHQLEEHYE